MCVAHAGRVISVEGDMAMVDFSGNKIQVHCGFVPVAPDDRVLVHAGYVMQVVSASEADEMDRLLAELGDLMKPAKVELP